MKGHVFLWKLAKNAMEKKKDTHDLDLERDLIGIVIKFLTENNQKLAIRTEGTPTSTVEVPTPTFIQMPLSFLWLTTPDHCAVASPTSLPTTREKPHASSSDCRVIVGHSRFVPRSHPEQVLARRMLCRRMSLAFMGRRGSIFWKC